MTIHLDTVPSASFGANTSPCSVSYDTARVLIVDDEPAVRKMLTVMLSQAGIFCIAAAGASEALEILRNDLPSSNHEKVNAVISDLRMPGTSGMELLSQARLKYPQLAFLMATGVDDVRVGVQAMREGADDYLIKPFQLDLVVASLERAFQKKRLQQELENYRRHLEEMIVERTGQLAATMNQLQVSYAATLEALGSAIDLRDSPTAGHCRRVFLYSLKIARALGALENQLKNTAMGAWLHDIGKLAIPDNILLKPAALTDEERAVMRRHVEIGYDLIKEIPFLADAAEIVLGHHERWDGSGYPRGLRADAIPLGARIFAVADTFDAMTSDRPYRSALPFQAAREVIQHGAGTQFDSKVAQAFLSFPNETWETIRRESTRVEISSILTAGDSMLVSTSERQPPRETHIQHQPFEHRREFQSAPQGRTWQTK